MRVAIYPGSFDPITYGHMDIIERGCGLFDKVVVAIAKSEAKNTMFTLEDRINLAESIYEGNDTVEVVGFPRKLTVDLAKDFNACAIIRGLRHVSDFEFEFQMAMMNFNLNPNVKSLFMMPDEKYIHLNSTVIKDVARLGGDISDYVPKCVQDALYKQYNV